jgi:hypothetical protein
MKTTLDPKPPRPSPVHWPRPTPTLRPPPSPLPAQKTDRPPVQPPPIPAKVPRPSSRPARGPCCLPLSTARDTIPEFPDFDAVDEATLELEALCGEIEDDDDDRPTLECFPKSGLATTWEMPDSRSAVTIPPTGPAPCPGCGHRNGRNCDHCSVCGHRVGCHERHLPGIARLSAPALWAPVLLVVVACASLLVVAATSGKPVSPTARQPLWSAAHGAVVANTPSALLRASTETTVAAETPPKSVTKSRVSHVKTSRTHKLSSSPRRKDAPATRPPSHKPRPPRSSARTHRR